MTHHNTGATTRRRRLRGEHGNTVVLTAFSLLALMGLGAVATGGAVGYTAKQDVQRAADLGALAAAAQVPSVAVAPDNPDVPEFDVPPELATLEGETASYDLLDHVYDPEDWYQSGCSVARVQFEEPRSPVARLYSPAGDDPSAPEESCHQNARPSDPVTAALAQCAGDLIGPSDCAAALVAALDALLPVWSDATEDLDQLEGRLDAALDPYLDELDPARALLDRLDRAAADAVFDDSCLLDVGDVLSHPIDDLLERLEEAGLTGLTDLALGLLDSSACVVDDTLNEHLPGDHDTVSGFLTEALASAVGGATDGVSIGVDLGRFVPAVATPSVTVTIADFAIDTPLRPFGSLGRFQVDSSATARRVFKRAVAVPTMGVECRHGLPPEIEHLWVERAGAQAEISADAVVDACGSDGDRWLLPPDLLTTTTQEQMDHAFDAVESLDDRIRDHVVDALTDTLGCDTSPPDVPAELCDELADIPDPVKAEVLFEPFEQDVRDATAPPPDGSDPTLEEVLASAEADEEAIWVIAPTRTVDAWLDSCVQAIEEYEADGESPELPALCDPEVPNEPGEVNPWEVLTLIFPELAPSVISPALDVVPAVVNRDASTSPDDPAGYTFELVGNTTHDALASRGLYRARLSE